MATKEFIHSLHFYGLLLFFSRERTNEYAHARAYSFIHLLLLLLFSTADYIIYSFSCLTSIKAMSSDDVNVIGKENKIEMKLADKFNAIFDL